MRELWKERVRDKIFCHLNKFRHFCPVKQLEMLAFLDKIFARRSFVTFEKV